MNENQMLFNIAQSIIRYQRITQHKKQLMKRRENNANFIRNNDIRVRAIQRAKYAIFNDATR